MGPLLTLKGPAIEGHHLTEGQVSQSYGVFLDKSWVAQNFILGGLQPEDCKLHGRPGGSVG